MFALVLSSLLLTAEPSGWVFDSSGATTDPAFFPIGVWLQSPGNAARYKQAGINLYIGLWEGPTEEQLNALRSAGMPVICDPNRYALAHRDDPIIAAWMHGDEPDNAQAVYDRATGKQTGWGPCVDPDKIVSDYKEIRERDPSRPVLLNLGQGVANDAWKGRGSGASLDDYPRYAQGADIVSFDVYPVVGIERPDGANYLWYVPKGVERLQNWVERKKPVWAVLECTHIGDPDRKATPEQVRSMAWMALIQGARGIVYFVHQFEPRFIEQALLEDPEMLAAVTRLNQEISKLAPVLNTPDAAGAATVRSSSPEVPVSLMVKKHKGDLYLFSASMRNAPTRAIFQVEGLPASAEAQTLSTGENVAISAGRFEVDMAPYAVRLYRIALPGSPQ